MGKGKKSKGAEKDARAPKKSTKGSVAKLPKKKCCESKTRCGRCPLRMLKEGTLPEGYTVHRRKLVKRADAPAPGRTKKSTAA